MPTRRGHNEGTVKKRADGRWEAQLSLPNGERKSVYAKTRQEVQRKLRATLQDIERGLPVVGERQTVAEYLTTWLETVKPSLVIETWEGYAEAVNLHIIPTLGDTRLSRLSAQQVQSLYAQLLASKLSSTTVRRIHATLHRALEQAMRLELVARNVTGLVDRPRKRVAEIHPLTASEAQRLLDAAQGHRLEALFTLALATGMRQGELRALKWADVDLDKRVVRVNATLKRRDNAYVFTQPKTAKSRRQIAIPAHVVGSLRSHRARQLEERLALGEAWIDSGLVFCNEIGEPLSDGQVRRPHWALLKLAGLPRTIRFHDLRHTAATILLGQRVNPKVVSEMLGHSSIAITLDIYSHVLPDMQQDAAQAMSQAMGWE